MASPHGGVSSSRPKRRGVPVKPGVPWFVSVTFFVAVLRVLAFTLLLLVVAIGFDPPSPRWLDALIMAHGAAMITALVFVLNGFGWARLAWLVLSLAQFALLADIITVWVVAFDLVVLVILLIPPSNRYMTGCAAARRGHI